MHTAKQKQAAEAISKNLRQPNPRPTGEILREVGYSEQTSLKPKVVTDSLGFKELMEQYLPDDELMKVHQQLLRTTRVEHMVFPIGPKTSDEADETVLSDEGIREMIAEVGCKVRKIVRGETARHVYFWSPDAATQKSAVELAYKIKGRITNKVDAKFTGELAVALVEFVGDDPAAEDKDTDS